MTQIRGYGRLGALVLMVVTAMLVYPNCGWAAEWEIPGFGVMNAPQGFKAVDLGQWVDAMAPMVKGKTGSIPTPPPGFPTPANMPFDIKCYQLQFNDNEAYHIAFALVLKSKQDNPYLAPYFGENDPADGGLQKLNDQMAAKIKEIEAKLAEVDGAGLKVLDFKPITRMTGTTEVIYTMSGRVIIDLKGVVVPMYAKIYFLYRDGKMVAVLVGTSDAEAKFWGNHTDKLFRALK